MPGRDSGHDYVIVGAGAAGCVIAARLSEDPSTRVLLIEAGGSDRGLATKVPLLTLAASADPDRSWNFVTEPIPGLNGRRQNWHQGRIIGGSSSVNGMTYMRGHPSEYDGWAKSGCEGWTFRELLPYFKRTESNSRGAGPWHGGSGPMKIRPAGLDLPIDRAFLRAVEACGYPVVEDLNAGVVEGFGRFDCNIDDGLRVSAARAYLYPAYGRRNLRVIDRALTLKVLIEHGRARGIEVERGGRIERYRADREVVLCAGALSSPALLMASGIGPADHLTERGVRPLVDAPEVGENLRNHPAFFQEFHCTEPVTAYSYFSPLPGAKAVLDYAIKRKGPLAESFFSVGGFIRSDRSLDLSDTTVLIVPSLSRRTNGMGSRRQGWWSQLPSEQGFVVVTSLGRPHSVGRVRLRPGSRGALPRVSPNFFDDERDMRALVRSVRAMRAILRNVEIGRYIDGKRDAANLADDPLGIETSIRASAESLSHPTGTCRMGSDPRAVVDAQLRVAGVEGLRVADNSIIPCALNSGTHAAALMIGERASDLIKGLRVSTEAIHER